MSTTYDTQTTATFALTGPEAVLTAELAERVAAEYPVTDDEALLRELPLLASELPIRVRRFLRSFALDELAGHCVVAGHLVDDARIGPTPSHWKGRVGPNPEHQEEILLLLYGALLGEPFTWATQQDGHFINDVFPVREYERAPLGTGSRSLLELHTEDAFHAHRADYIILAGLRNPREIPTIIAEPRYAALSEADVRVLRQERFRIVPDTAHWPTNNTVRDAADRAAFRAIEELSSEGILISALFGSPARPLLRFDEAYMGARVDDPEAARAFDALYRNLLAARRECPVSAGSFVFLNNHRVVHGRNPYVARYDGTDRWLKRVNITSDLRKSSGVRGRLGARVIG